MARNNRVEEPLQQQQSDIESKNSGVRDAEKRAREVDTAGKTENFFTRNVKLITFLICITVAFLPFVITYINDYIEMHHEDPRPAMTVDDLTVIAEKGKDLRQRDIEKFEGELIESDMQGMKYAMYRIPVLHESDLVLSVSFDASMDYVFYLNLINLNTQEELDLLSEANKLEDFLFASAN